MVELGPGLLSSIYDGIQRPLPLIREESGSFISRGLVLEALNREKKWEFQAIATEGDEVSGGDVLGIIDETQCVQHRVMVPPNISGKLTEVKSGTVNVDEVVAVIDNNYEVRLFHHWPVRKNRPYLRKLDPEVPLVTGQRIFDTFFPIPMGGSAIIPGGFGTGKTVTEQTLAKWANADVIVYVGCGERGNEMTEVLTEFPELEDPRTKAPLMDRTILIANTSNMPVAAREASIYTGITLAEFYRDMGYNVAMMADSTSRWGEALREVSGRLEEMPGEEGYPAYLATRLASFYERTGRIVCLGAEERVGSVTVIGAVSPPGGDFSEPMTQNSLRISGAFWALDTDLAHRRHFPAINWIKSYSLYTDQIEGWIIENLSPEMKELREEAMTLLQKESELEEIVQLVGPDALPESEKIILETTKIIREDYLQQFAFHEIDGYCPLEKQLWMLKAVISFYRAANDSLNRGVTLNQILKLPYREELSRLKELPYDKAVDTVKDLIERMNKEINAIEVL